MELEILSPEKLKQILGELKQEFQKLYGERLMEMKLYGSYARGDAEPGSDIDVLVILKGEVNPGVEIRRTSNLVAGKSLEHDVVLTCFYMSDEYYSTIKDPLVLNVQREGLEI